MGEWEERISQVLNDPAQMAEISRMAQSLLGGAAAEEAPPGASGPEGPGLDPGLLGRAAELLRAGQGADSAREGLLRAMEPFLSPKRREKLSRARQLARLGRLAKLALGEEKGDG